jgi:hypothetical protein
MNTNLMQLINIFDTDVHTIASPSYKANNWGLVAENNATKREERVQVWHNEKSDKYDLYVGRKTDLYNMLIYHLYSNFMRRKDGLTVTSGIAKNECKLTLTNDNIDTLLACFPNKDKWTVSKKDVTKKENTKRETTKRKRESA